MTPPPAARDAPRPEAGARDTAVSSRDTRPPAPPRGDDSAADVFRALADPTRRGLLDALFARDGQTLGALCAGFPGVTRFAVMKHLAVLEAAGLVVTRREGRTKLHFLNPVPIAQIADRWISKYARPFTGALVGLQHQLERGSA